MRGRDQVVLGSTSQQANGHLPENSPPTPGPMENSSQETAVPWHKMPPNLILALRQKKRPKPKERREMIRIIIDDVLAKVNGRPGRGKLREIAREIVQQYPCSFQDQDINGTTVIGTGYDSVFIQLENRLENVSRPFAFNPSKRPSERGDEMRKKSMHSDRYGCVEWQPTVENSQELESKQQDLKNDFKTRQLDESVIRKLMTDTYAIQRAAINKGSIVKTLMEEWPFLFEAACMFDHTRTLLGMELQTKMAEEVSRKGKGIKDFLRSKGIKMAPNNDVVQLISGIAKFFREKPEILFQPSEESAETGQLMPSTPCILIMGDHLYKIAVDQDIVNAHISSMIVALSYTFATFYVLNIKYPKDMALTLEFIQRVFLGINPERGSKAEKKGTKHPHLPPRLLKFLCELNTFENPWMAV